MKFIIYGAVTVSCHTVVEAGTAREAITAAMQRMLADMQPSAHDADQEQWVLDTDGSVEFIRVEPHAR